MQYIVIDKTTREIVEKNFKNSKQAISYINCHNKSKDWCWTTDLHYKIHKLESTINKAIEELRKECKCCDYGHNNHYNCKEALCAVYNAINLLR